MHCEYRRTVRRSVILFSAFFCCWEFGKIYQRAQDAMHPYILITPYFRRLSDFPHSSTRVLFTSLLKADTESSVSLAFYFLLHFCSSLLSVTCKHDISVISFAPACIGWILSPASLVHVEVLPHSCSAYLIVNTYFGGLCVCECVSLGALWCPS